MLWNKPPCIYQNKINSSMNITLRCKIWECLQPSTVNLNRHSTHRHWQAQPVALINCLWAMHFTLPSIQRLHYSSIINFPTLFVDNALKVLGTILGTLLATKIEDIPKNKSLLSLSLSIFFYLQRKMFCEIWK